MSDYIIIDNQKIFAAKCFLQNPALPTDELNIRLSSVPSKNQ